MTTPAEVTMFQPIAELEPWAERRMCRRCGQSLPKSEFYVVRRTGRPFGQCKACVRERNRCWTEANREHHRQLNRDWHARNPERSQELRRRWFRENRDRCRQAAREWGLRNRENVRMKAKRRRDAVRLAAGTCTAEAAAITPQWPPVRDGVAA